MAISPSARAPMVGFAWSPAARARTARRPNLGESNQPHIHVHRTSRVGCVSICWEDLMAAPLWCNVLREARIRRHDGVRGGKHLGPPTRHLGGRDLRPHCCSPMMSRLSTPAVLARPREAPRQEPSPWLNSSTWLMPSPSVRAWSDGAFLSFGRTVQPDLHIKITKGRTRLSRVQNQNTQHSVDHLDFKYHG
jgi:hypothetical protein